MNGKPQENPLGWGFRISVVVLTLMTPAVLWFVGPIVGSIPIFGPLLMALAWIVLLGAVAVELAWILRTAMTPNATTTTFSLDIQSITWGLFLVQLFLAVCLPGGSILGLNLKLISDGLFLLAFAMYLVTSGPFFSNAEIIFITAVAASLCFWSLVGVWNGQTDAGQILSELRQIASAISVAWLSIFAVRRRLVTAERLITAIIYGIFCVSAVKVALVASSFFANLDPIQVVRSFFGEETRAEPIILGLIRLDFAADIVGAFALFALLAPSVSGVRFSRTSKPLICVVVLLGSGFLTYARAIWFIYFVSIFVAMIVERSWKAMAVTVLAVLVLGVTYYDVFSTVFEARFVTEAESSDVGRVEQARDLMAEIKTRPILGKGMGAHFSTDSRTSTEKYSYELQWLAFLMQFGIVGVIGILLLVAASTRDLVLAKHPAKPWMFLLFALWLLESSTNPHMTSSYAGATFGLFMAMFYRMRNTNLRSELRVL
jgi:hypothetical protein